MSRDFCFHAAPQASPPDTFPVCASPEDGVTSIAKKQF